MFELLIRSLLLGVGLAMDAFSVSVASGLADPNIKKSRMLGICSVFSIFQFLMPVIGWFCVHRLVELFASLQKVIPWAALVLLLFIGIKMIVESRREEGPSGSAVLGNGRLFVLGIATSIDALSVGLTNADYRASQALISSLIIGVITFFICLVGIMAGRKIGRRLSSAAPLTGGIILIVIGIEIFIKGVFF